MTKLLSIGDVARATGVRVSTVRYYDEIGLISTTTRVGGKRRFATETVGRINFVRRAREVGFALDQINAILDDSSGDWHSLLDAKLDELVERRSRLDQMISMLDEVRACGCQVVADCETYLAKPS